MSKSSRHRRAQRRLDSKMGNFTTYGGKAPDSGFTYTKPGSNKLKT